MRRGVVGNVCGDHYLPRSVSLSAHSSATCFILLLDVAGGWWQPKQSNEQ